RVFLACTGRTTVIKSASSTKRRSSYVSTPMDFKCSSRMFLVTAGSSGRTSIMASCKKVGCESLILALKKCHLQTKKKKIYSTHT
ncbi:hypothetical protein XENOCAPTIV_023521, partial [Xenoophorus captivus]